MRIEVGNLSYVCRERLTLSKPILDGVSFTFSAGDLLAVIGPSGAGKTTLAQVLAGILEPSDGDIRIGNFLDGGSGDSFSRLKAGMVFQNPEDQFFEETLEKDIMAGLVDRGWDEAMVEESVRRAFCWVGLDYDLYKKRSPFNLSSGEKRLAAIACVLATDLDVIIFDEPTVGLDPQYRNMIYRLLRNLYRQKKMIVVISHDIEIVRSLANRVLILKRGKTFWFGDTEDLFSNPDPIFKAGLELPEIPFVLRQLEQSGFNVDTSAKTVDQAAETISRSLLDTSPEA